MHLVLLRSTFINKLCCSWRRVSSCKQASFFRQEKYGNMRLPAPLRKFVADTEDEVYFAVRLLIFAVNIIAWIFSIFFICIGTWIIQEKHALDIDGLSSDPAVLLLVIGCILFIITFTGCVGTLRENLFLLKLYMAIIVILFIIEIITALVAFLYADKTEDRMFDLFKHGITDYLDDPDSQFIMDEIQKNFQCCGAYTFNDWNYNEYFKCSSGDVLSCGVPYSCCKSVGMNSQCGFGIRQKDEIEAKHVVYTDGCIVILKWWINDHLHIIGGLGFAFACVQLLLILIVNKLVLDLEELSKTADKNEENANSQEVASGV